MNRPGFCTNYRPLADTTPSPHDTISPMNKIASASMNWRILWFLVAALLLFTLITEQNRNTSSDPRGTLLVSQAIVQHGTVKLDSYGPALLHSYGYVFNEKNGHYYNYFPLGSALLSVPIVALANGIGIDMGVHEPIVQMAIVSLCALGILLLLYQTARLFLGQRESFLISLLCWFGSAYASTLGTALWSHDFAVLFASLAIYLALKDASRSELGHAIAIGLSLFVAYFCRPTLAMLAPFLLTYLLLKRPRLALVAGGTLAVSLLAFSLWSMHEYSQPLPDYYMPSRLEGGAPTTAMYGNLFSPARGLLIFSPFLVLPLLLLPAQAARHRHSLGLLLISVAWPATHWFMVSRFPHWWAGWSYGSRLMVDVLPGLFVGLFACLGQAGAWRRWLYPSLLVLGSFSVAVNTYQGLYNPFAVRWNVEPNIDERPEYLFNWKYPQFLHNAARHSARLVEFQMQNAAPMRSVFNIDFQSKAVGFLGFSGAERDFRWTEGTHSAIAFKLADGNTALSSLRLRADFLGEQRMTVSINGKKMVDGVYSGSNQVIELPITKGQLAPGMNVLAFDLPDAHRPPSADLRVLAMAFRSLSLN